MEVRIDESDGERRAVASRGLSQGEVALVSHALVNPVLKVDHWRRRCHYCLGRRSRLVELEQSNKSRGGLCSRCKMAWYCCREHQAADFQANHKKECRKLGALLQLEPATFASRYEDVLLLGRVIRAGEDVIDKVESMQLKDLGDQESKVCIQVAKIAVTLFTSEITVDVERVANLAQRFTNNNFGVTDELYETIAAGVFPRGAILNHSCDPNCVVSYHFDEKDNRVQQVFRIVKDAVAQGEELCHAYCDTAMPLRVRQQYLESSYGFICNCSFCSGEDERRNELEMSLVDMLAMKNLDENASVELFKEKLKAASDGVVREPQMMPVVGQALNLALESSDFDLATQASESLVEIYKRIYYPQHPLVGLQLHTLGDLLEDSPRSIDVLAQAKACLQVSLGSQCEMVQNLQTRLLAHPTTQQP